MSYERDNIRRMRGYAYGEQPDDPDVVKLNTNENPYPPSPGVAAVLRAFDADRLRRYPPPTAAPFRALAAERLGLAPEQVLATNGGDEALRLAVTAFVAPGAAFAMADPSYSLYEVLAQVQDCHVEPVPMAEDWTLPADFAERVNAVGARLTCIVNPHAPSGALVGTEELARLADALDGVLLIDEAYVDFVDPELEHDATPLLREFDNVLLLRTLSKGYSLAGLRFGFLAGHAGLIEPMATKVRDSYNQDVLAQELALAAFRDEAHAGATWRRVREERVRLRTALLARGFDVPPSQANFVLATPPGRDRGVIAEAVTVFERLRAHGIVVRHLDHPRVSRALRITVGTPAENDALLAALDEILDPPCC